MGCTQCSGPAAVGKSDSSVDISLETESIPSDQTDISQHIRRVEYLSLEDVPVPGTLDTRQLFDRMNETEKQEHRAFTELFRREALPMPDEVTILRTLRHASGGKVKAGKSKAAIKVYKTFKKWLDEEAASMIDFEHWPRTRIEVLEGCYFQVNKITINNLQALFVLGGSLSLSLSLSQLLNLSLSTSLTPSFL